MSDYVITGRPVGKPLNPEDADETITDLNYVGETITATLDPEVEAQFLAVGALESA